MCGQIKKTNFLGCLRTVFIATVQLKYHNPHAKYKLYYDASELEIGGVLGQADEETGEDRPYMLYISQVKTSRNEIPYSRKKNTLLLFSCCLDYDVTC